METSTILYIILSILILASLGKIIKLWVLCILGLAHVGSWFGDICKAFIEGYNKSAEERKKIKK